MRYQEKAGIIFRYLKESFPNYSIGHRWDFKLDAEWYFLQEEKTRTRILVPKKFFESTDKPELESRLESLNLNSYIQSDRSHYIVINHSGASIVTF